MKKTIIIVVLCIVVVVVAAIMFFHHGPGAGSSTGTESTGTTESQPGESQPGSVPAVPLAQDVTSPKSAYDIAGARARKWKSDVALVKVVLGDTTGMAWTFTFVSPEAKGEGFQIVVNGQNITSATQISYAGGGTVLPANLISPVAAMAEVHSLRGYSDAVIVALELLYNATAKQWYWGVETSAGTTVTVNATP